MEIIFDFSDNSNQSPNWFDWLSLAVSVLSIIIAYLWGRYIYKKEKEDRQNEELENIKSEKDLFESHLYMLNNEIREQIKDLKKYVHEKGFSIKVNPNIQIDFLNFVNIKSLYKDNDRNKVNNLLSALYGLSHFYNLLKREVDDCNKYYNQEEKIFKENYQEVFYIQIDMLSNKHLGERQIDEDGKLIEFELKTPFMNEYKGITETFDDYTREGIDNSRVADKLNEIMNITGKYRVYDIDATTVNTYANRAYLAYVNMKNRRKQHFEVINTFLGTLEDVNKEIENYNRTK